MRRHEEEKKDKPSAADWFGDDWDFGDGSNSLENSSRSDSAAAASSSSSSSKDIGLCNRFVEAVMQRNMEEAIPLAKTLLEQDPRNGTLQAYQPVLLAYQAMQREIAESGGEKAAAGDDDEDDDDDDRDSDSSGNEENSSDDEDDDDYRIGSKALEAIMRARRGDHAHESASRTKVEPVASKEYTFGDAERSTKKKKKGAAPKTKARVKKK